MKDKIFLDTNIFIYAIDKSPGERRKQNVAQELIRKTIQKESGLISIQVMQEFLNISTRKIQVPLSVDNAIEYLKYIAIMEIVVSDFEMVVLAARLSEQYELSFWDSMIIQTALAGNATMILSEDMQDGMMIEDLKIVNPFYHINAF